MTSSLAKQLKAIQQEDRLVRGVPAGHTKRPSFLFDEKEAADLDNESIFALGLEGFIDLCKDDPTLRLYQDQIFDPHLLTKDLSLMTKKEKKGVDNKVAKFLILLCPHFQKKAAHKVMEWMVRKWRVNETNVDALMVCILPHHDTIAFIRMVQIIYFTTDSRWSFLFEKVKQGGSSITRKLIAQRCTIDPTVLDRIICGFTDLREHMKLYPDYKFCSLYVSFVTFLVLETIVNIRKFGEIETIAFYQRLETLIQSKDCPEALVGGMMIFMQLCEQAPLSDTAIVKFIRTIVQNHSPSIEQHVVLTISRTIEAGFASEIEPQLAVIVSALTINHWNNVSGLGSPKPKKYVEALANSLSTLDSHESRDLMVQLRSLV